MILHIRYIYIVMATLLLMLNSLACQQSPVSSDNRSLRAEEQKKPNPDPSVPQSNKQQTESEQTNNPLTLTGKQVMVLIEKEFGGLFQVDRETVSPNYIMGDFNSDGVKDIGVAVRVISDVSQNDKSKPPFGLYKPLGTGMNAKKESTQHTFTLGDIARYKNDTLLAVIHGNHENGWEQSQPKQKFILLDILGMATRVSWKMSSFRGKLKPVIAGDEPKPIAPPPLLGDAIIIEDVDDSTGSAVYWDGERYRWYPTDKAQK